jgi:hypothetical protein
VLASRVGSENEIVSDSDRVATSAADLFDLLWESLADVLGTAAGATLLRRAIKRAGARTASSESVSVTRNGLDYEYRVPETWKEPGDEAVGELRIVAAELRVLLVELTGPVVVDRLGRLAPFRKSGIQFSDEASND